MNKLLCWPWFYELHERPNQTWSLYRVETETNSPHERQFKVGWVVKYPGGSLFHYNYLHRARHFSGTSATLEEAQEMVIKCTEAKIMDEKLVNLL